MHGIASVAAEAEAEAESAISRSGFRSRSNEQPMPESLCERWMVSPFLSSFSFSSLEPGEACVEEEVVSMVLVLVFMRYRWLERPSTLTRRSMALSVGDGANH